MIDPLTQRHHVPVVAPAAILGGVGRIDFDKHSASFFRFARELGKERRPTRVMNALGQTMMVGHAVDVQIFRGNDTVAIDDRAALLVGEVLSTPGNALVDTSHSLAMLAAC